MAGSGLPLSLSLSLFGVWLTGPRGAPLPMTSKRPRRPLNPEPAPLGGLSLAALAENNRDLTSELVKRRAAAVILAEKHRDLQRRLITARERPAGPGASSPSRE